LGPDGCLAVALAEGEKAMLRVKGDCMEPDVRHQATVRVDRPRFFVPGDVVAFHCPHQNRLLIHRFLGYAPCRGAWKLMTMADRGVRPDPLVDRSRVLGRVIAQDGRAYRVAPARRLESLRRYLEWCARYFARRLGLLAHLHAFPLVFARFPPPMTT
jgi:hypothetical protein